MTTEENVEHIIVLLLYEIHVIRTVQISNISDNNMLEMKSYSGHFDVFDSGRFRGGARAPPF